MFANTFQSGFISIFYSVGSNPLQLWDKQVKNGHIRRVVDDEVRSLVLEISGTNVATTYITCPIKPRVSLGIKLPFLVMIIKNMKKYFTFEIQIRDDKNMHRRFRVSNFQSATKVRPFCTTMPIGLSAGWNQVQFNLSDFTKRAYGSTYLETTRVQIHANVRIRRIYFSDQLYSDEEMPNEYKLFLPTPGGPKPTAKDKKKAASEHPPQERKPSKRLTAEDLKIDIAENEIPSGAHPTPAGHPTSPAAEEMLSEAEPTPSPAPEHVAEEPTDEVFVDTVETLAPDEAGEAIAPSEEGEVVETVATVEGTETDIATEPTAEDPPPSEVPTESVEGESPVPAEEPVPVGEPVPVEEVPTAAEESAPAEEVPVEAAAAE